MLLVAITVFAVGAGLNGWAIASTNEDHTSSAIGDVDEFVAHKS